MSKASKSKRLRTPAAPERTPPAIPVEGSSSARSGPVLLHLILIAVLGFLAYSNTFHAPFQFDDYHTVTENAAIRKLSNIPAMFAGYKGAWASRPLLQATLALNFHVGEFKTWGYHAVNIAIHLINGILLYLLVVITGRHLGHGEKNIGLIALLSVLLFIAHPVQTEAVTYIVSRSMLFVTTFYLLGMILFLKAVTAERKRGLYIVGLLLTSLIGMGSREDFAVFPVVLLIYDLLFISKFRLKGVLKHWRAYLPVLLSLGYFVHLVLNNTYDRSVDYPTMDIPRSEYALTQFNVHWTYLRLLLLPVNQNLDYDYPISRTLLEFPTLVSFLGYAALWGFGIVFARRRPVAAFPVLWFLVTLLPVSFGVTFLKDLKLDDVIFEHRLYLPGVTLFPLAAVGIFHAGEKLGTGMRRVLVVSLSVILVLALVSAAFVRNGAWRSEARLWEDVVIKSPEKARGHNNLGIAYVSEDLIDKAIEHYRIALNLEPDYTDAHNNLGNALGAKGLFDEAIEHLQIALMHKPNFAQGHYNLGIVYKAMGLPNMAIEHFLVAIMLKPDYADAHNNLGVVYKAEGSIDKAIEHFLVAIRLEPNSAAAHNNLGNAYRAKGLFDEAIKHLRTAVRLKPDYADAYGNLGVVYSSMGRLDEAIENFQTAARLSPNSSEAHYNLGLAFFEKGLMEEARREFETVLRMDPTNHSARRFIDRISNK